MQLPSAVVNLLTPALKDKPIKAFGFGRLGGVGNNEFGSVRAGIEFAIEVIQSNQKLKQFGWANNPIENRLMQIICLKPLSAILSSIPSILEIVSGRV